MTIKLEIDSYFQYSSDSGDDTQMLLAIWILSISAKSQLSN